MMGIPAAHHGAQGLSLMRSDPPSCARGRPCSVGGSHVHAKFGSYVREDGLQKWIVYVHAVEIATTREPRFSAETKENEDTRWSLRVVEGGGSRQALQHVSQRRANCFVVVKPKKERPAACVES